ncbi:hypothetical protein RCF34_07600 [Pseudomonas sp. 102515]|uniref:hypothetical protein n=1 Tax=Pseudomonas sp. 102515 TaxID=3071568 RepID=UPI00280235FE|nr:hypothetical protein [Pseudomonas sp. 102515]MDQ7912976.1 hypothetical protein [Pseudomonas sp. 102515]
MAAAEIDEQRAAALPLHLVETTSALTTLSRLSRDPRLVARVSVEVADYVCQHGLVIRLPLQLRSHSEPPELASRRSAQQNPTFALLVESLYALQQDD